VAEELRFMTELAVAAVWGLCLSLGVGFAIWAAIGWLWNRWMRSATTSRTLHKPAGA
jgi:hypothetical protein